jgi:26S proteasome regulatory subunit N4
VIADNFLYEGGGPDRAIMELFCATSQNSDVFSQRLQAANSQHLSASTQSQLGNQSPHREFNLQPSSQQVCPGTAIHMQKQQEAETDALGLEVLDYRGTEEDATMPLSPQMQYRFLKPTLQESQDLNDTSSPSCRPSYLAYLNSFLATSGGGSSFAPAPRLVPGATQQQYQFVLEQQQQAKIIADQLSQLPVALPPVESSNGEYATDALELEKPAKSNANSGTYTCTYHGCTLRFDTPTKLKQHKLQRHRQSASLIDGVAAAPRDSQAGPHKCEWINLSTDKPCNVIFSRPYDLTRHEDTIHNACKKEVHCQFCTVTVSRNDALSRHMRKVHPEIDFPRRARRQMSQFSFDEALANCDTSRQQLLRQE